MPNENIGSAKNAPMSPAPLVSVVIPTYNYGRYVGTAIESALTQGITDMELLVLNNASTDNTDEVVRAYANDPRLHYIVNETNIGGNRNFQKGTDLARGEYLLLLSADDQMLPGSLISLIRELRNHPEAGFAYGRYYFIDDDGKHLRDLQHPGWPPSDLCGRADELGSLLEFDCYISMPTVLFRRTQLQQFMTFSVEVGMSDYDLFCRMAQEGVRSIFLNRNLAAIRLHEGQISVGDNVVKSGVKVRDQVTLIERYVTEANLPQLTGHESGIMRLLDAKIAELRQFPEAAAGVLNQQQSRLDAVRRQALSVLGSKREQLPPPARPAARDADPAVSVIIPTRNRPDVLVRAVRSVLAQTFQDFEIIVINDGGTPVESILEPLDPQLRRIVCLRHSASRERCAARNSGIRVSRGKYIAYLDDDDYYFPEHLATLVPALEAGADVVYADSRKAIQSWNGVEWQTVRQAPMPSLDFNRDRLLVCNHIPILALMHRRTCIDTVGGFDETLGTHEDWELWIRLSLKYEFKHIASVTSEFTFRSGDDRQTTVSSRADFQRTAALIHERYSDQVLNRPDMQEAQRQWCRDNFPSSGNSADPRIAEMVQTLSGYIAGNEVEKAIGFYRKTRPQFTQPSTQLDRLDRIMESLDGGNDTDPAQVKKAPPPDNPEPARAQKAFPDGHYYSPIVDIAQVGAQAARIWPENPDLPGIDFDPDGHRELLENIFPQYLGDYHPRKTANLSGTGFYTDNDQFSGLDAVTLFVMLRHFKPARMMEIGSGFSSLLTAEVNLRFFNGTLDVTCIEPHPRPFLSNGVPGISRLITNRVEEVSPDIFDQLRDGDVLFIDSSHVSKTGSDVNHLFFEIIPRLRPGVIIHIHDIFLPNDYPRNWVLDEGRSWNEQYLVRALLTFSTAFKIIFGCCYASCTLREVLIRTLGDPPPTGASLWIKKIR